MVRYQDDKPGDPGPSTRGARETPVPSSSQYSRGRGRGRGRGEPELRGRSRGGIQSRGRASFSRGTQSARGPRGGPSRGGVSKGQTASQSNSDDEVATSLTAITVRPVPTMSVPEMRQFFQGAGKIASLDRLYKQKYITVTYENFKSVDTVFSKVGTDGYWHPWEMDWGTEAIRRKFGPIMSIRRVGDRDPIGFIHPPYHEEAPVVFRASPEPLPDKTSTLPTTTESGVVTRGRARVPLVERMSKRNEELLPETIHPESAPSSSPVSPVFSAPTTAPAPRPTRSPPAPNARPDSQEEVLPLLARLSSRNEELLPGTTNSEPTPSNSPVHPVISAPAPASAPTGLADAEDSSSAALARAIPSQPSKSTAPAGIAQPKPQGHIPITTESAPSVPSPTPARAATVSSDSVPRLTASQKPIATEANKIQTATDRGPYRDADTAAASPQPIDKPLEGDSSASAAPPAWGVCYLQWNEVFPLELLDKYDFKAELATRITTLASQFGNVEQVVFDRNPYGSRVIFQKPRSAAEATAACRSSEGGGFKSIGWKNIEVRFIRAQAYILAGAPRETAEKQQAAAAPVPQEIDGLQTAGTAQGLVFKPSHPKAAPPIDPEASLTQSKVAPLSDMRPPPPPGEPLAQEAHQRAPPSPPRLLDAEPRTDRDRSWRDGTPVPIAIPSGHRPEVLVHERYQHPADILLSGEHWSVRPNALLRFVDGEVDQLPPAEDIAAESEERQLVGAFDRYAHNLSVLEAAEARASQVLETDGEGLEALTPISPSEQHASPSSSNIAVKLESWRPATAARVDPEESETNAQHENAVQQSGLADQPEDSIDVCGQSGSGHTTPAAAEDRDQPPGLDPKEGQDEVLATPVPIKAEATTMRTPPRQTSPAQPPPTTVVTTATPQTATTESSQQAPVLRRSTRSVTPQARAQATLLVLPRSPSFSPPGPERHSPASRPASRMVTPQPRSPSLPPEGEPPAPVASTGSSQDEDMEMDVDSPPVPSPRNEDSSEEEQEEVEQPTKASPTPTPTAAVLPDGNDQPTVRKRPRAEVDTESEEETEDSQADKRYLVSQLIQERVKNMLLQQRINDLELVGHVRDLPYASLVKTYAGHLDLQGREAFIVRVKTQLGDMAQGMIDDVLANTDDDKVVE